MDTNTADIVSRRSVERVYFPDEPQYTRFFVKKYQKRPPLVNRSYHLRIHLVDVVVQQFLSRPSSKTKVVVNLGCGNNPLPWRSMHHNTEFCKRVKFVDVDSPDVIKSKCGVIKQTPELKEPLTGLEFHERSSTTLTSEQYCQFACDLTQLHDISEMLSKITDMPESEFLFIAEASFERLGVDTADSLVSWAGTLSDAEFCLLGQALPNGPSCPFAKAMLQQPTWLKSENKTIKRYPTISSQQERFEKLGWLETDAWTLWGAWADPTFFSSGQRKALDEIEAFDEWEDLAHFSSYHFLLRARNGALVSEASKLQSQNPTNGSIQLPSTAITLVFSPTTAPKSASPRRFGNSMLVKNILGQQVLANAFGRGTEGHIRSYDLYSKGTGSEALAQVIQPQGGPGSRSCFTLTDLGDYGYLLVGGRTSPSAPFSDCWVFKKDMNRWTKTYSLPLPLFGHMVERLGGSQLVLLAGGRPSPAAVHPGFLLYHPNMGWMRCSVKGTSQPPALFGGLLLSIGCFKANPHTFRGILAGGMTVDGIVSEKVFDWVLNVSTITEPTIEFTPTASHWATSFLSRYGAISTRVGGWNIVVGGISSRGCMPARNEIVRFRAYGESDEKVERLEYIEKLDQNAPRPIFIGASIITTGSNEVIFVGGGISSSSTEAVWSQGIYSFNVQVHQLGSDTDAQKVHWKYQKTLNITNEAPIIPKEPGPVHVGIASAVPIPRLKLDSAEQFISIRQSGQPLVFEGLDLGPCLALWDLPYLAEHVGPDRKVVVHESTGQAMDFLAKNFRYNTQTFQEFARDVDDGKRLYLRALSLDKPSDAPANLDTDFPMISKDFVLPPQMEFVKERLFSSVLRISGPVNMWLHYDVLANIYCQVKGTKRFYLFPPSDVTQLGFAPGASSSSIDVFSSLASSSLSHCHPYETELRPGDVLFLPQLWLHTATPVSSSSVAVNVFFRDLDKGYSSGRDVYGNRDLAAYEKARQDISRISKSFKDLPRDTRQFYLGRIADELLQVASE